VGAILLTGADGYLGRLLVRRLLGSTDAELVLAVRARDAAELRGKQAGLAATVAGAEGRVRWAAADLCSEDPFAGVAPTAVGAILHAAAVTRFNVDDETAQRVNVDGTRRVLTFARRCPRLERVCVIGTVYASGLRAGPVGETALDDRAGFANAYERSKWAAEQLLVHEFADLPWRLCRAATVLADDAQGRVTHRNAVHNTLQLLFHGLLSLVPGRPDVPVYCVTGEFVVDAILATLAAAGDARIYHACHTRAESLTLGELLDAAFGAFERDEAFRGRRILRPIFADARSFELLVGAVRGFGGGVVSQAVGSIAPFARQLFVAKELDNRRLRALLPAYAAPDPKALVERACLDLVRTRWGRSDGPLAKEGTA
jgi:nucleoside-diphosphate-sugar epimerase